MGCLAAVDDGLGPGAQSPNVITRARAAASLRTGCSREILGTTGSGRPRPSRGRGARAKVVRLPLGRTFGCLRICLWGAAADPGGVRGGDTDYAPGVGRHGVTIIQ